jgi:hypothetical protein
MLLSMISHAEDTTHLRRRPLAVMTQYRGVGEFIKVTLCVTFARYFDLHRGRFELLMLLSS